MKRLSLFLGLFSLLIFSCQEQEKTPKHSIVEGKVENSTAETVLIQGQGFEARIPITDQGSFKDTLHLKKDGLYQMYVGRERTMVYLEKGKNLDVQLDADSFDESLTYSGDLAASNNFLAAQYLWEEEHMQYKELFALDEDGFFKKMDRLQKQKDSLHESFQIENDNFNQLWNKESSYSRAALIENYQDAHRYYSGDKEYVVSRDFYDDLTDFDYQDTLAFRNSLAYRSLMEIHFNRLANEESDETTNNNHTISYLTKVDQSLPDGYAKDELMMGHLQFWLKPDENLDKAYGIYKNSNPDQKNLETLTQRYNQLKTLTTGNPSPTFSFENYEGGTTSLEDLAGQYVYIDVWATWCGPCLREIPFLKEIEEDYKGKDLQVVSISIDEPKDYDKWKQMVADKSLGGIQLIADNNWNSQFVKKYAILGIPRFILLDPKGNIVSADAPRPSDPALREKLDNLL